MSKEKQPNEHIKVFIRCRPLMKSELNVSVPVEVHPDVNKILVRDIGADKSMVKSFSFDKVFGSDAKQSDVYNAIVAPVIQEVISGFNCTIFAYGQTGTGKTFTIEGGRSLNLRDRSEDPLSGIIPRSMKHLFNDLTGRDMKFDICVSFLELYNEEIFDLLSVSEDLVKLKIFDNSSQKGSVIVQGLQVVSVSCMDDVYAILDKGCKKRRKAATLLNKASSRSHTIFTVTVNITERSSTLEKVKSGKLNLVDLAGSENIGRSGAIEKRAREAGNINQSLLALGRVITSLCEKTSHVPYRESKLTRLLQDSLGGQTKTAIIATISPSVVHLEETLNTLEYALRAKSITNKPELNAHVTVNSLSQDYLEEMNRLKENIHELLSKETSYVKEERIKCWESTVISTREEKFRLLTQIEELTKENKLLDNVVAEASNIVTEKKCQLENAKIRHKESQVQLDKEREDSKLHEEMLQVMQPLHDCLHEKLHNDFDEIQELKSEAKKIKDKLHSVATEKKSTSETFQATLEKRNQWNENLRHYSENLLNNIRNANETVNYTISDCHNHIASLKSRFEEIKSVCDKDFANISKVLNDLKSVNEAFQEVIGKELQEQKSENVKGIEDFQDSYSTSNETTILQPLMNVTNECETSLLSISTKLNEWKQNITSEMSDDHKRIKENLENLKTRSESAIASVKQLLSEQKDIIETCNRHISESLNSSISNKQIWNEKFLAVEKALSSLDTFSTECIKNEVENTTQAHSSSKSCASIGNEITRKLIGFCDSSVKDVDKMQKDMDFHVQNTFSGKWEELKVKVDSSCSRYKDLNSELAKCSSASQNVDGRCSDMEDVMKKKVNEQPKITQCIQEMSDSLLKFGDIYKSILTENQIEVEEMVSKDKMILEKLKESSHRVSNTLDSTLVEYSRSLETNLLKNLTVDADTGMNGVKVEETDLERTLPFDLDETITSCLEDAISQSECPVCSKKCAEETFQADENDSSEVISSNKPQMNHVKLLPMNTEAASSKSLSFSPVKRPHGARLLSARKNLQFPDVEKLTHQLLESSDEE